MVEKQLTDMPAAPSGCRPLAVVDLDGTILTGNSLHEFIRCALIEAALHCRPVVFGRLAAAIVMRKLRLINHITMKNRVLRATPATASLRCRFRHAIDSMRSAAAARLLREFETNGIEVLLATAASEIYVPWIWNGNYIATPALSRDECRGAAKRRRALDYAAARSMTIVAAMTDHSDDIPILSIESAVRKIVISPTAASLAKIAAAGITPEIRHHGE